MILNGIYDATLQSLYIFRHPSKQLERAELYIDYYWIEKCRQINLIDRNPAWMAKKLKDSPLRSSAEPDIKSQLQRVENRYRTSNGGLRRQWYPGTLETLAHDVGLTSEYEMLQRHLSGFVHSSYLAISDGPWFKDFFLMHCAWQFSFRVLGRFAEYKEVPLTDDEREVVNLAFANVLGFSDSIA